MQLLEGDGHVTALQPITSKSCVSSKRPPQGLVHVTA